MPIYFQIKANLPSFPWSGNSAIHFSINDELGRSIISFEGFHDQDADYWWVDVEAKRDWLVDKRTESEIIKLFEQYDPKDFNLPRYYEGVGYDNDGTEIRYTATRNPRPVPPRSPLPHLVADLLITVERHFYKQVLSILNLLSWRYGVREDYDPLERQELSWSLDGSQWILVPLDDNRSLMVEPSVDFTPDSQIEVQGFIESNLFEPLAHNLWRESWAQRETNPRSALIIAVAAAEIGTKEFVSALAPDTRWLLEEIQSPDIIRILKNLVPSLIKEHLELPFLDLTIAGLIAPIENAFKARNTLAHKPSSATKRHKEATELLRKESFDRVLLSVSDLLWYFDYYRGYSWAYKYIRPDTRKVWDQPLVKNVDPISPRQI